MEVILANTCKSLTGSLDSSTGYTIRRHGEKFLSMRKPKGPVPPDGHWRFICLCAQLVQAKLYFADIRVSARELRSAFDEAHAFYGDRLVKANAKQIYNAREVLDFKKWI